MSTSLRLTPELEEGIKLLAGVHNRTEHGEMLHALRDYIQRESRRIAMKDERLHVKATFIEPGQGEGSTGTVAFGWEEAQEKAAEMRKWVKDNVGVGCRVDITPDKPDLDRRAFHGL